MDGEEWDGRKGSETVGKVRKSLGEKRGREVAEWGKTVGKGEGRLDFGYLSRGPLEFLVTPLLFALEFASCSGWRTGAASAACCELSDIVA